VVDEGSTSEVERVRRTVAAVEELGRALRAARAGEADAAERERLAREELVLANVEVAAAVARRYRNSHEPMEELVQTAYLGLVKAANGYAADRGHDFLAYAVPTISGEVKRYFRDQGWAVRPPRRLQELGLAISRVRDELENRLARSPTVAELAYELAADEDDVIEAIVSGQSYRTVSLDTPLTPDDQSGTSLGEALPSQDDEFDKVEELVSLRPLLDKLSPRDRRILALWYFEELTQQQIGEQIGVTQMQVSRLINRALGRLRKDLVDNPPT
jgi:RNA polymerase sigma-B factor